MANSIYGMARPGSLAIRDVVFIDAGVVDAETLLNGISAETAVYQIDSQANAVAQISQILAQYHSVGWIHLVAHGSPGCIHLGKGELSLDTLNQYEAELKTWANSGAAQLSIYGCNVAAGDAGAEFIEKLHGMTGIGIAASTTLIGQADLGGNWELDATKGQVSEQNPFTADALQAFLGVLNTFTVTSNADDGAGSLREAINAANTTPPAGGLTSNTIEFDFPEPGPVFIALETPLPDITAPVIISSDELLRIDANGQPVAEGDPSAVFVLPRILLQGNNIPPDTNASGLTLLPGSDGSTINNIAIQGFSDTGLLIRSDNNTVTRSLFGGEIAGQNFGNGRDGIGVGSDGNRIEGNFILANGGSGIRFFDEGESNNNRALSNRIFGNVGGALDSGDRGEGIGNDTPNPLTLTSFENGVLTGTLEATPGVYLIQVFASPTPGQANVPDPDNQQLVTIPLGETRVIFTFDNTLFMYEGEPFYTATASIADVENNETASLAATQNNTTELAFLDQVNSGPTFTLPTSEATFDEGESVRITVTNVQDDDSDPVSVFVDASEINGEESVELLDDGNGTFSITLDPPVRGFDGEPLLLDQPLPLDIFAMDDRGGISIQEFALTIADVAPVAVDDSGTGFATNEDTVFTTASVFANDTVASTDTLTVTDFDTASSKQATITSNGDGTFRYDPADNFEALNSGDSSTDTFTYTIEDEEGNSSTATVTVEIAGVTEAAIPSPTPEPIPTPPIPAPVPPVPTPSPTAPVEVPFEGLPISLSLTAGRTTSISEILIIPTDDANGAINGIAPGSEGYQQAQLERAKVLFSTLGENGDFGDLSPSRNVEINSSSFFQFAVIEGGSFESFRTSGGSEGTFQAVTLANGSSTVSGSTLQAEGAVLNFGGEAGTSLSLSAAAGSTEAPLGAGLQGEAENAELFDFRGLTGTATATFEVFREAAFNNTVGFFRIDDVNGGILSPAGGTTDTLINPGDGDAYIQAALANRIGVSLTGTNGTTETVVINDLAMGAMLSAFIIADGTVEQLLDDDTSNDPNIYFTHVGANSDSRDHVRLLGTNIFGFEDLPEGGDMDYDDIIIRASFTQNV